MKRNSKPSFGRELKSTADKVPNDIGVTNEESVGVGCLRGFRTVEVRPECSFDPRTVLEELLKFKAQIECT